MNTEGVEMMQRRKNYLPCSKFRQMFSLGHQYKNFVLLLLALIFKKEFKPTLHKFKKSIDLKNCNLNKI